MAGNTLTLAAQKATQQSLELTKTYAKAMRAFAKPKPVAMAPLALLLSFDGEAYEQLSRNFKTDVARFNQASSAHPIIELLDGLFSYLLLNRDPSLAHRSQEDCKKLYESVCEALGSYHELALADRTDAAKAKLVNQIRATVWAMVKTRSHGDFYNTAWLFLMRTAAKDRASFQMLALDDIDPYVDRKSDADLTADSFKSNFVKTIAAARKAQLENPNILVRLYRMLSASLARLLTQPQGPAAEAPVLDDSADLRVETSVPSAASLMSPQAGGGSMLMSPHAAGSMLMSPRQLALQALQKLQRPLTPSRLSSSSLFQPRRPSAESSTSVAADTGAAATMPMGFAAQY